MSIGWTGAGEHARCAMREEYRAERRGEHALACDRVNGRAAWQDARCAWHEAEQHWRAAAAFLVMALLDGAR